MNASLGAGQLERVLVRPPLDRPREPVADHARAER